MTATRLLVAVTLMTTLGCTKYPYHLNIHRINESLPQQRAVITISDPQLYSRESLIDDRRKELQYLDKLIDESPNATFLPQLRRELSSITALTGQLALALDPAKGAQFRRADEIANLQSQIRAAELENRVREVQQSGATGTAPGTPPTAPSVQSPGLDTARRAADDTQKLAAGVVTAMKEERKALKDVDIPATPQEKFRDMQAYRGELWAARNAVNWDDLHDLGGNALLRLQFRATVMPGDAKDRFGLGRLTVKRPKLSGEDLTDLYRAWLAHVNYRIAQRYGSSAVPDVHYEALGGATGLFAVVRFDTPACARARRAAKQAPNDADAEAVVKRDCEKPITLAVPVSDVQPLTRLAAFEPAVKVLRAAASAIAAPDGQYQLSDEEKTVFRLDRKCTLERRDTTVAQLRRALVPNAAFEKYYQLQQQQAAIRSRETSRPVFANPQAAVDEFGTVKLTDVLETARAVLSISPYIVAAAHGLPKQRPESGQGLSAADAENAYDEFSQYAAEAQAFLVGVASAADAPSCVRQLLSRAVERTVDPLFYEVLRVSDGDLEGQLVKGKLKAAGLEGEVRGEVRGRLSDGRLVEAVVEHGTGGHERLADTKVRNWTKGKDGLEIELDDTALIRDATSTWKTSQESRLSQVRIESADVRDLKITAGGDVYAYGTSPIELAQRTSTATSAASAAQFALALSAVMPAQGAGADAAMSYLQAAAGKVEALERTPIIVGFSDRAATSSTDRAVPNDGARQFGWVFGPRVVLDPKSRDLRLEHGLVNQQVSADVSVPGWWPRLELDVDTAWIANWHDVPGTGVGALREGDRMQHQPLRVSLPPNRADLDGLTSFLARKSSGYGLARAQIANVVPTTLSACAKNVTFLIYGRGIWRSTEVYLGGVRPEEVRVLPDMEGIAATFKLDAGLPRRPAEFERTSLTVWTRNGSDSHEIKISGGMKGDKLDCGDEAVAADAVPAKTPTISAVHPTELHKCATTAVFLVSGADLTASAHVYLGSKLATSVTQVGTEQKTLAVRFTDGPFMSPDDKLEFKLAMPSGVAPVIPIKLTGDSACPSGADKLAVSKVVSVPVGPVDVCAKTATIQIHGTALAQIRNSELVVPTTAAAATVPSASRRIVTPLVGTAFVEVDYRFPKLSVPPTITEVELHLNGNEVTSKLAAVCGQ
jgi:hypothetical protein